MNKVSQHIKGKEDIGKHDTIAINYMKITNKIHF